MILGGAGGNLIDRIVYGYVVDFIDIYVENWHWPAFNVADMAISIGAGLVILDSLGLFRRKTG
jgi:signal peptidase II